MNTFVDPLNVPVPPENVAYPVELLGVSFTVLTFENDITHMCYAVDADGAVWYFCFISEDKILTFDHKLLADDVVKAAAIAAQHFSH